MTITLIRTKFLADRVIGALHIDDVLFCDTLEPPRNGTIYKAIPQGEYTITLNVQSPRFVTSSLYRSINARLPRLLKVPGRDGILIHIGNYPKDTKGCVLVGELTTDNNLQNSKNTFFKLYNILERAAKRGESIRIFII